LQQTGVNDLPYELLSLILLDSVVDRARESNDLSLDKSLAHHASVCDKWSTIAHSQKFRKEAKAHFYTMGAQLFLV